MKFSEMNARQKKAYNNIYYAARDCIGGLENGTFDYPHDSNEYEEYVNALTDHDGLVDEIYQI